MQANVGTGLSWMAWYFLFPDETYFLGGVDKTEVLRAFGAHIFFDDQRVHAERAAALVPAAQVLWPEADLPPQVTPAKPVAVRKRGKGTSGPEAAKPATPRAGSRPAAPRARARSAR